MSVCALIVAAGQGTRMGRGRNKALLPLAGVPVLLRTVCAFSGEVDGVLVVTREEDMGEVAALLPGVPVLTGSDTRQRSVLCGLRALPEEADIVLVHDAARPLVSRETIRACIASVRERGSGVASVPVKDTIKAVNAQGAVTETPPRGLLRAAQTPQAFYKSELEKAIEALEARGKTATDDAGAMEAAGHTVYCVDGNYDNIKLTTPEDMKMAERMLGDTGMRIGYGYDVHRLVEDRTLILCGVTVPWERGLLGHSDADVALHALMDAMLGAAAMGDIGRHFPDTDAQYKGASSLSLLNAVVRMLAEAGYGVQNADITIAAQKPKLAPYIDQMAETVAEYLGVPRNCVNVKATTTEGLGFEGTGEGMSAHAVVLLRAQ